MLNIVKYHLPVSFEDCTSKFKSWIRISPSTLIPCIQIDTFKLLSNHSKIPEVSPFPVYGVLLSVWISSHYTASLHCQPTEKHTGQLHISTQSKNVYFFIQ